MKFDEFKNELMDLLTKEIADRGLEDISMKFDTLKSPDGMNDRLIVSVGKSNMSMAFRLQEVFDAVNDGESMDCAVNKMVNTITDNIEVIKTKESDVKSFISDYEQVKDHTYLRLVPGNSPILDETPHRMIEDMALVVNINLESFSDDNGRSCVVASKPLMEMYGIDENQLFADAENNSLVNEPLVLKPLEEVIKHMIDNDEIPSPEDIGITTYIATNKTGFHGASVAAYPGFVEYVAETIGGSFYMIPSSVHEFLIIKDDGTPKAKDLNKMIRDVNKNVLNPRDILSNQCYHYDAKAKMTETGLEFSRRRQAVA